MVELQSLFDSFVGSGPIFKSREILTISFTPGKMSHREKEVETIGRILAPALRGGKPSNLFVYGKTGTGKSLVTTHVAEELKKAAERMGKIVKVVYVNCKMKRVADTEYRLLAHLSKEFGRVVPFTGLPTDKIYQHFFEGVDEKEQVVILIIDEIDTLVKKNGDGILYNLTRINQELKKAKLCVVGITNDLGFIDYLDSRVRSSLSEEELVFPPYNAVQLKDILYQRSKDAFFDGSVDEGVLEKCAALAAQEHGDARRALDLLRVAGELSERSGSPKVEIIHVDQAQEKIDHDRVVEVVRAQPKQSQAILWSVIKLSERGSDQRNVMKKRLPNIQTGEVFDVYSEICKAGGLKVLTQRRVSDLIAEFETFGVISTRVVSKGRHGRTRIIELNLNEDLLGKVKSLLGDVFGS